MLRCTVTSRYLHLHFEGRLPEIGKHIKKIMIETGSNKDHRYESSFDFFTSLYLHQTTVLQRPIDKQRKQLILCCCYSSREVGKGEKNRGGLTFLFSLSLSQSMVNSLVAQTFAREPTRCPLILTPCQHSHTSITAYCDHRRQSLRN